MAQLPERDWLSLADALALICKRCDCTTRDAQAALQGALIDAAIEARGSAPLNARANIDRAWSGSPDVRRENIPAESWTARADWNEGHLGRYRYIEVEKKAVLEWLRRATKRQTPEANPSPYADLMRVVKGYVEECKAQGKNAGQKEARAAVRAKGLNASREQVNAALVEVRGPVGRGRPKKSPTANNPGGKTPH